MHKSDIFDTNPATSLKGSGLETEVSYHDCRLVFVLPYNYNNWSSAFNHMDRLCVLTS